MPLINIQPKEMENGDRVTFYTNTVGTAQEIFSFKKEQETIILRNKGTKKISYIIGSYSGTLDRSEYVRLDGVFSSIALQAESGTQAFEVWADEVGNTKSTGTEADINRLDTKISTVEQNLTSKLAEISTNVTPEKSLKRGASIYLEGVTTLQQFKDSIQQALGDGVNFLMVAIQYQQNATANTMTKMGTATSLESILDYCRSINLETVVRLNLTDYSGGTKLQPSDINTWFTNWKNVCVTTANICKSYGVKYLGIANELMYITNGYKDKWQDLNTAVKNTGVNTFFSLNHYEYANCILYDVTDVIGINFWPCLTYNGKAETDLNLRKSFYYDLEGYNHIKYINDFKTKYNKQVWLTEIGCLPNSGALTATWEWNPVGVYDEETQALYFKYIFEVVAKIGAVDALMLFHINKGATWNFLDKQAEQVVKKYWGGQA